MMRASHRLDSTSNRSGTFMNIKPSLVAVFIAGAVAAMVQSSAVAQPAPKPAAAGTAVADPRWAAVEHSHWLADGRDDAPRKVYVFTDPNCPYCTKLWSDARPWVTSGKVQLRHLIVGILTPTSPGKAATILSDKDPAAKLAAYEASHAFGVSTMLASGQRHPTEDAALKPLDPIPVADQAILSANARLMQSFGLQATPGVIFIDEQGRVLARQGIAPGDLPTVLGPR
jgi:thiol:disulfide interchange protein DsbG